MSSPNLRRLGRVAVLLALIGAIALAAANREHFDVAALESWVRSGGGAAPLVFIVIYTLAAVLFLPGSVLTLAAGALFGPIFGTLYSLTGATVGATLAFLAARYLAAPWVERAAGGRLRQLKEGVEEEGWRFVAFVRLVPLFPYNLLNYALGLTRIRLAHYVIPSFLCMAPGAVAYTYLGYAGREALAGGEGLVQKLMLAIALLAAAAFLPRLAARLRRGPTLAVQALRERLSRGEDLLVLDVRSPEEFNGELGHIPGSRNVPVDVLGARLQELAEWRERPVAVVCRTERRSARAARVLARAGFRDVHVVRGGMEAWAAAPDAMPAASP